ALAQQFHAAARSELKKALAINRGNVRVVRILARIEMAEGNIIEALKTLQKVHQYAEAYAAEASTVMLECTEHSRANPEALRMLENTPGAEHGSRQLLSRVAVVRKEKGNAAALRVLQQSLAAYPSLGVLARLLGAAAREATDQQDVLQQSAFVV